MQELLQAKISEHRSFGQSRLVGFDAKANPGKLNMASVGNGTMPHVAGELFNMMAGVNMVHVPYRGAPAALTDLLGGQVQVYFATTAILIEHVRTGKLRALAVTRAKRSEVLPDIATVSEFLPGFEASVWFGIGAPNNTPVDIVNKLNKLNKEINAGLAESQDQGAACGPGRPATFGLARRFGNHISAETEKWANVIRAANIKPD